MDDGWSLADTQERRLHWEQAQREGTCWQTALCWVMQFLEDATSAPAFPEVSNIPEGLGASLVHGECSLCLSSQVISETQIGFFFSLKASQAGFSNLCSLGDR